MPRAAAPRADARGGPTSYRSVNPSFQPWLGTDRSLGPAPYLNMTGTGSYTGAHLLHYAGVITPCTYR